MTHPTRNRSLAVESLESRTLMAGNVTAKVVDGSLEVRGDQFSNGVAIEQTAANTFRVRTYSLGGSPTSLNGTSNNIQTFSGVTTDVLVSLGESYNEVSVNHLSGGAATIGRNLSITALQSSNARIQARVGQAQGGYLTVHNAAINISNSSVPRDMVFSSLKGLDADTINVGGHVDITGTGFANSVVLDALRAASLSISTGNGRDFVRLANRPQITGDVRIFMGHGEDFLRIGSLTAQNLTVNMGVGPSDIDVFGNTTIGHEARFTSDNQADTTSAIDDVSINGLHVNEAFFVWLSSGNDRLTINNTSAPRATLRGGTGLDTLLLGDGNAIDELDQSGFERFQI